MSESNIKRDIYFEEEGRGTPVFLLHGFPFDHTIWRKIVPDLARKMRIITQDLRGHGQSKMRSDTIRMEDLAGDVLDLMDWLSIEKAVLVGHSMGGYAALAFARLHPDRLAGLCMLASHAAADDAQRAQGRLDTAKQVLAQGIELLAETMPSQLTNQKVVQEEIRQIILKMPPRGAASAMIGMADRKNEIESLRKILVPVQLITGEEDRLINSQRIQEMIDGFPDVEWTSIQGSGHLPMLENPQAVINGINQLIGRVEKNR